MAKKIKRVLILLVLIIMTFSLTACTSFREEKSIVSVEKISSTETLDYYVIQYSDGTFVNFEMSKDGSSSSTTNTTLEEVFDLYKTEHPDATIDEFIEKYLDVNYNGNALVINKLLSSSAKIYTEFTENYRINPVYATTDTTIYLGSAVVYKIETDYTYFITNYHVVYNSSAMESDKIAKKITCYLYGSEGEPVSTDTTDSSGCYVYNYGSYAIDCEYVGGSISADIAIVKARTDSVKAINPEIQPITFAEKYYVGETAIAIGNPEGEGISVTEGVISVDNENINLAIDGYTRNYRVLRIDTAIYSGSSGGGLFNSSGELIGITNAGDVEDQNVNYALPVEVVKGAVENIMFYSRTGEKNAKIVTLGITVSTQNSKYVYNQSTGYGQITEDVVVQSVTNGGIAYKMGIKTGDRILSFTVNGQTKLINREFEIGDILLYIRKGDEFYITVERGGVNIELEKITVQNADLTVKA